MIYFATAKEQRATVEERKTAAKATGLKYFQELIGPSIVEDHRHFSTVSGTSP